MAKGIMYVDNIRVEFDDEPTIMDVCRKAGVEMPNFCFHSDLSVYGACRMCMVEDLDTGKIDAACTTKPKNGMRIRTNTSRLLKYRRMTLELMLASHCRDCTACEKNRSCRLQEMAVRFGIHHVHFKDTREHVPMDFSSPAVTFDLNKCILCGDCVRVCKEVQGMSILHFAGRGPGLHIEAGDDQPISTTHCVSCGQCAAVCTTGAITVKNDIGAAEIFGTSGGVAEAVLRCCLPDKSKNVLRMLEHSGLRGTEAVRFVTIPVNGRDVRVALAHGLANAAKLLDQIENGEVEVDLVEVMSCRTGCVGGAGQPYALMSTKLKRAHGLYEIDRSAMFKRSERNPVIDAMYANGLADRAHELLHIEYKD